MTREHADILIDYLETLEARTNHQSVMAEMNQEKGIEDQKLDDACRALGKLAERDYSIL